MHGPSQESTESKRQAVEIEWGISNKESQAELNTRCMKVLILPASHSINFSAIRMQTIKMLVYFSFLYCKTKKAESGGGKYPDHFSLA